MARILPLPLFPKGPFSMQLWKLKRSAVFSGSVWFALLWFFLRRRTRVTVSPDEMAEARRWVAAVFEGAVAPGPQPGMEVVANYDLMQKNARFGKPLKLAGTQYTRGLFCHAPSKIVVRLPSSGKTFEAVVGVDSNEQTIGGQGSVEFVVQIDGKEAFRSTVLKEGMPAVQVRVDLAGANGTHPRGHRFRQRDGLRPGRLGRGQNHPG